MIELDDLGHSASQIAASLDEGCTRNMVRGKLWRLHRKHAGLPFRKEPQDQRERVRMRSRITEPGRKPDITLPVIGPARVLPEPQAPRGIRFIRLKGNQCKWPMKGEGYALVCCGLKVDGDVPYCEFHTRKAQQPRSARG